MENSDYISVEPDYIMFNFDDSHLHETVSLNRNERFISLIEGYEDHIVNQGFGSNLDRNQEEDVVSRLSNLISFIAVEFYKKEIEEKLIIDQLLAISKRGFNVLEIFNTIFIKSQLIDNIKYHTSPDKEQECDILSTDRLEAVRDIKPNSLKILIDFKCQRQSVWASQKILGTNCSKPNEVNFFTFSSSRDKRRKVLLNESNKYNYLPIRCIDHWIDNYNITDLKIESCIFSHNLIELMYHPLVYKAFRCNLRLCVLKDEFGKEYCPYSHYDEEPDYNYASPLSVNTLNQLMLNRLKLEYLRNNDQNQILIYHSDFRFLIEIENKKHVLLINRINNSVLGSKDRVEFNSLFDQKDPIIHIDIQTSKFGLLKGEFDCKTYKTVPCPLGSLCKEKIEQCLNYHSFEDRRRDTDEYCYTSKLCEPKSDCSSKENCRFSHNIYEVRYHPEMLRKSKCMMNEQSNQCKSYPICPNFHGADEQRYLYKYYSNRQLNQSKSIPQILFFCHNCKSTRLETVWKGDVCGHSLCNKCLFPNKSKYSKEVNDKDCLICKKTCKFTITTY